MDQGQILAFLKENIAPLQDSYSGPTYRASVTLTDGTILPCVVFSSAEKRMELARKRFAQTVGNDYQHQLVIEVFTTEMATIRLRDIADIKDSSFAWPETLLNQIHGETTMGWTAFTAVMRDGKTFSFGTPFNFEFFDMPYGYSYTDIVDIHSGMVMDNRGLEVPFDHELKVDYFRDRLFFTCYVNGLPTT